MAGLCSSTSTTNSIRETGRRTRRRPESEDDNLEARSLGSNVRTVDEPYEGLKVEGVDLMIEDNSMVHHTDQYILTEARAKLVLRRGFPFHVKIRFSRKVNTQKDDIRFVFKAGSDPNQGDGTRIHFSLLKKDPLGKWSAKTLEENENEMKIEILTPSDCIVCLWQFEVEILEKKEAEMIIHKNSKMFPINIYILFNPWNKADIVHLDDEEWIKEYILSQEGAIWVGDPSEYRTWSFGQFQQNILDCTMYLLDLSDRSPSTLKIRGNPILVSRKLSAVGNATDEGGLLVGNWSGNYQGGSSPTSWRGSVKIMQTYWEKKAPVKFGQCWVFSGVLTTMCRAIGIPCRSVTNFSSAHDTDGSITIDKTFSYNGWDNSSDSIWNFHVWNEVWMDRPDLPKKYAGWQAIDCTPQETSNKIYQCGPMSVAAIKAGDVASNYDGPFIFAEVNADVVTWMFDRFENMYLSDIDTNRVGKVICTRARGDEKVNEREDVTEAYKYTEGTSKERDVVHKAADIASTDRSYIYSIQEKTDVKIKLVTPTNAKFGEDFAVIVKATNMSSRDKLIYGTVSFRSVKYTGDVYKTIKIKEVNENIPKMEEGTEGKESITEVNVTVGEYGSLLAERCIISVVSSFITEGTDRSSVIQKYIFLKKPILDVTASTQMVEVNKPFSVKLEFENPLDKMLKNCEVNIEGVGIKSPSDKALKQSNVSRKGIFSSQVELTATQRGWKRIGVVFSSTEIIDVAGNCWVHAS